MEIMALNTPEPPYFETSGLFVFLLSSKNSVRKEFNFVFLEIPLIRSIPASTVNIIIPSPPSLIKSKIQIWPLSVKELKGTTASPVTQKAEVDIYRASV